MELVNILELMTTEYIVFTKEGVELFRSTDGKIFLNDLVYYGSKKVSEIGMYNGMVKIIVDTTYIHS